MNETDKDRITPRIILTLPKLTQSELKEIIEQIKSVPDKPVLAFLNIRLKATEFEKYGLLLLQPEEEEG